MPEVQAKVDIQIKPEDINEAVAKAVLGSMLGERVKEAVDAFCKKNNGYGALEQAVVTHLQNQVREILSNEPYVTLIREGIRPILGEKLEAVVKACIEKGLRGY